MLADGTVASRLSGLVKDNVGYDLAQIMAGSEGTLGVVTKVVLHLVPVPAHRVAALIALRGRRSLLADPPARRAVTEVAVALRPPAPARPRDRCLELVATRTDGPRPGGPGLAARPTRGRGLVFVEASGGQDPTDLLGEAVEGTQGVTEVAVADEAAGRARLWAYRERHTEAIATWGAPQAGPDAADGALAEFAGAVRSEVSSALGGPRAPGSSCSATSGTETCT